MLQDSGRSRVIACHSQEIGNILLLLLSCYYHMDNNWRPGGTVLGIGHGLGWAIRARLWLHLSRMCRLRTVRCTGLLVKSQIYYPEHILAYGSGKACYSLVMGSGSFQTDWLEVGICGGLSTTLRPGLKCGGLESKFGRGPGTRDRSGMGWSRSCLGCERDVCFSGYPVGHIDSRIIVSAWRYGLTTLWHRNKNWKMKDGKMVLIVQLLLESRIWAYLEWLVNELLMTANKN
jgi:hypothetical protein